MQKACTVCGQVKESFDFYKRSAVKKGLASQCKDCHSAKKYKQKLNKQFDYKAYREAHKEELRSYKKAYYLRTKELRSLRHKERRSRDVQYRLQTNLRSKLCVAIRRAYKAGSAIRDLGCSISQLKGYLESKFQPGMTWDNWGREGWHIDHIMPLASFDLTNSEQLKQAVHYTNLQPLWASTNLSKGSRC